jgi:hypothetical protein
MARVMDVKSVDIAILKINPPLLFVGASGEVPTTGWTNIRLEPYFYIVPPKDGIWDFDFVGNPPTGIAGDVVLPAHASIVLPLPKWLKGVRVHAAQNSMEAVLGKKEIPHVDLRAA